MRYLINLPLIIAFASFAEVFDTTILSHTPRGGDAALGAAYAIFFGTFLTWIMLAFGLWRHRRLSLASGTRLRRPHGRTDRL
jgi:uncharacterized membrane protein